MISVNTAQRQAQQQGHSLPTELAWLATHGLLHLLGWDHPDEESLMQMLKTASDITGDDRYCYRHRILRCVLNVNLG